MEDFLKGMLWGVGGGLVAGMVIVAKNKNLAKKIRSATCMAEEKIEEVKDMAVEKIDEMKEKEEEKESDECIKKLKREFSKKSKK